MTFDRQSIADMVTEMLSTPEMAAFLRNYNVLTSILLSFATIAVIVLIVFQITKLAKASDNAQERAMAITGLLVCSACLAILGGIDAVYAILVGTILG